MKKPRISYTQPKSLCRSLVYYWGGHLLFSNRKETAILGTLVTDTSSQALIDDAIRVHRSGPNKAYGSDSKPGRHWSKMNKVQNAGQVYGHFNGCLLVTKKEVDNSSAYNDTAMQIMNNIVQSPQQTALALSLHYSYASESLPLDHGHTVGFYVSKGSARRSAGGRFFDPNVGTWQHGSVVDLMDFYKTEWLPNFIAGTLKDDPGRVGKGSKVMSYFRLVWLVGTPA